MSRSDIDPDVDARLTRLEAESDRRRRELADLVQHLPAQVSRRDMVRDAVADLRAGSLAELLRRSGRLLVAVPRRVTAWVRDS